MKASVPEGIVLSGRFAFSATTERKVAGALKTKNRNATFRL
jgi:hypothetical protein